MIDFSDAEKALNFLKETDIECAKAKAYMDGLDDQKKTIEAIEFMRANGSAAERAMIAKAHINYQEHIEKVENARLRYETIRNQRKSAELQIELWRSINSNQRKGNV